MRPPATLLEASDLSRAFGAFLAVDGVSLSVAEGSIHAVIGPNGAGKTTLFRLLSGILRPTSGRIRLAGHDVAGQRPHVIARRGLAQSFQLTSVFPRLTVLESVQAAVLARAGRSASLVPGYQRRLAAEAGRVLELTGLAGHRDQRAGKLSHGDQRALDVALALAGRPRLLLLDEPTAGMSAAETAQTIRLIAGVVAAEGLTVLFSEHDMDIVFGISDRVTVLHQGRVIADGEPACVRADKQVIAVYLGDDSTAEAS